MEFLAVYVREAHPTDGWRMISNDRAGIVVKQPRLVEERFEVAQKCCTTLEINMPLLVDSLDDRVGHAYSGMPDRLYVIDRDGKVAYKGGRGPFGFKTGEMEQALVMLLLDQTTVSKAPARVPLLSDEEAWKRLPPLEKGQEQPLPHWARALAGAMPKTTAYMLELDDLHRTKSPLGRELSARLRIHTSLANRCLYSDAYANSDFQAAKFEPVPGITRAMNKDEKCACQFAMKLCLEADRITDEEFAEVVKYYGEQKTVAIVALVAYACFQDRLLLSLGVEVEPGGPLKPLGVKFSRQPAEGRAVAPPRKPVEPPTNSTASERITDPDWLGAKFDELQTNMEDQRARPTRIRVPAWEEVKPKLPPGFPANRPSRVRWSLVCMGYQPELSGAWLMTMRTFGQEAKQDRVFEELVFWVVTRSVQCFY